MVWDKGGEQNESEGGGIRLYSLYTNIIIDIMIGKSHKLIMLS